MLKMYRLIPDDMGYYLNDDPYRTSAKTYGITQLNSGLNPLVYNPDPTTKLAKLCGLLGRTTKVKEEDKPRVPEPTNYKKLAKYVVAHSIVLIIINVLTRYFICFTSTTEEQKAVAVWLFSFMVFMIYSMMVVFSMMARETKTKPEPKETLTEVKLVKQRRRIDHVVLTDFRIKIRARLEQRKSDSTWTTRSAAEDEKTKAEEASSSPNTPPLNILAKDQPPLPASICESIFDKYQHL